MPQALARPEVWPLRRSAVHVVPGIDDLVEERLSRLSAVAGGDLDTDSEFGDRDRRDGGLVVVSDQRIEVEDRSFGVNEGVGIEQEQRQNRSCTARSSPKASISWLQARSIR